MPFGQQRQHVLARARQCLLDRITQTATPVNFLRLNGHQRPVRWHATGQMCNCQQVTKTNLVNAALGFTGKAAIHPRQIPTLNRCFSPTEEQIAYARRVIEEFDRQGTGLVVIDNKLIEKPVLRSMIRVLAIAERL